jgi:hypothetical protein
LQIIQIGAEKPPVASEKIDKFLTEVIALFKAASTASPVTIILVFL